MPQTFDLWVPCGPKPGWVARIIGPSQTYGFEREFLDRHSDAFNGYNGGQEYALYKLDAETEQFYESCQSTTGGNQIRVYYQAGPIGEGGRPLASTVTPERVFDKLCDEMTAFFWPRWFDRLVSTHTPAHAFVRHKAGVGEVWQTDRQPDCLYLTTWVPVWDEKAGVSEIQVVPLERFESDEGKKLKLETYDLDTLEVVGPQGPVELPRGNWNN